MFISQGVLQAFVGLGAVVSGALLVSSPDGRLLGMPVDMLAGTPFRSFLVPGLILVVVNGLGSIAACVSSFRRHRLSGYAAAVFGLGKRSDSCKLPEATGVSRELAALGAGRDVPRE